MHALGLIPKVRGAAHVALVEAGICIAQQLYKRNIQQARDSSVRARITCARLSILGGIS